MIDDLIKKLTKELKKLTLEEKVEALNKVKLALREESPFKEQPVDTVIWVKSENIHANDYNPNVVASPEMKLLHLSIKEDGFTQPIVAYNNSKNGYNVEIVDGFHRNIVGREYKDIREAIHGYLPITIIDKLIENRMASTIRHNRARGSHQIAAMSHIVIILTNLHWSDEKICKELGMSLEELVRLKQITGLTSAFINHEFSKSWKEFSEKYQDEEHQEEGE